MTSGVRGQRRNVESNVVSRQNPGGRRHRVDWFEGFWRPPSCPHALFIGTEPYRFLPEENGVQEGQRAGNSSPVALASCHLVGEDLGSCHRTVLKFGGVSRGPPTLGVSSRHVERFRAVPKV